MLPAGSGPASNGDFLVHVRFVVFKEIFKTSDALDNILWDWLSVVSFLDVREVDFVGFLFGWFDHGCVLVFV